MISSMSTRRDSVVLGVLNNLLYAVNLHFVLCFTICIRYIRYNCNPHNLTPAVRQIMEYISKIKKLASGCHSAVLYNTSWSVYPSKSIDCVKYEFNDIYIIVYK